MILMRIIMRCSVAPVARVGPDQTVSVDEGVIFDAGESGDDICIAGFPWNFGDGEPAEGLRVVHIYDSARVFNVTLTVEDGAGNKDFDYVTVILQEEAFLFSTLGLLIIVSVASADLVVASVVLLKRRRLPVRRSRK